MRPLSLKLAGFKGIRSNSGKDELMLDFSHLGGLVALVGPNGVGKTTILDNLHPYRIMPYRSGSYSPKSFSFYDECYGRGAIKDLHFEANGDTFRSLLLIDAEKRKQEAFLFKLRDDGQWESLCDGKVEDYDRVVTALFGSPQLFFTSVFRCQDAPKLSDYTKGEIKDIFVELLGIEKIKEIGIRAKESRDILMRQLERMQMEKEALDGLISAAGEASKQLAEKKQELAALSKEAEAAESEIERLQSELQQIKAELAVQQKLAKQKGMLKSECDQIKKHLAEVREVTGKASEIRGAAEKSIEIEAEISATKSNLAEIEKVIANLNVVFSDMKGIEKEMMLKQKQLSELALSRKHRFEIQKRQLEDAVKKKELLQSVPCGEELHEKCPLLSEAVKAKDSIIRLIPELHKLKNDGVDEKSLSKEIAEYQQQVESMNRIQKNLGASEQERKAFKERIELLEKELKKVQSLGNRLSELESAEKTVKMLEADLKNRQDQLESILTNQVEQLSDQEAKISGKIQGLKALLKTRQDKSVEILETLGSLDHQIEKGKQAEQKVSQSDKAVSSLTEDITQWSIIEKAFSNDGIIALEIDDAGPTISAIANDLLQSCFGSRFSVKIDTQVAKSNGKGLKETFDVVIYDAERDESKSLKSMSGGEKVWIEESITRAISLYNAMKSGRKYQTLFTDEKDGALDFQKKKEFFSMKRKVLEIGHYDMELFISQSPEIQELADHILQVA